MNFINLYGTNSIIIFVIFLILIILIGFGKFFLRNTRINLWLTPIVGLIGFIFGIIIGAIANYPKLISDSDLWYASSFEFIESIGFLHISITAIICIFTSALSISNYFYALVIRRNKNNLSVTGFTLLFGILFILITYSSSNLLRLLNINAYDSEFVIGNNFSAIGEKLDGFSIWTDIVTFFPNLFRSPVFSISYIIFLLLAAMIGVIFGFFFQTKYPLTIINKSNSLMYKISGISTLFGSFSFLILFAMSSPIGFFWNNLCFLIINLIPFLILLFFNWYLKLKKKTFNSKFFYTKLKQLKIIKCCCFASVSSIILLMFSNQYTFINMPTYDSILPQVTLIIIAFVNIFVFSSKSSINQSQLIKISTSIGTAEVIAGLRTGVFIPGISLLSLVSKKIYEKSSKLQKYFLWI